MKTILTISLFFALSTTVVFGQKIYSIKTTNSPYSVNIFLTENCDTTTIYHHNQNDFEFYGDYEIIDDNNLLLVGRKNNGGSDSTFVYQFNISNQLLEQKFKFVGNPMNILKRVNGKYLLSISNPNGGDYSTELSGNLTTNSSSLSDGVTGSEITEFNNQIGYISSNTFTTYNILSGVINQPNYLLFHNGSQITHYPKQIERIENSNQAIIAYFRGSNSHTIGIYIVQYDFASNTSTKIDSILINSSDYSKFGNGFNYAGNGDFIVNTNQFGSNGIGQISIYNMYSKTTNVVKDYQTLSEQITDPINFGYQLFSARHKAVVDGSNTQIDECFQSDPNVSFSNFKCADCSEFEQSLTVDELTKTEVKIYPNPVSDFVIISDFELPIELYNLNGQLMTSNDINFVSPGKAKIDLSTFIQGFYILKSGTTLFKIFKQ